MCKYTDSKTRFIRWEKMGLCGKLNCCSSGGKKSKPKASCQGKGGDGVADDGSHPAKTPETHGNTDTTPNATHDTAVTPTAPNGINMNSKTDNEPIYAKVDKRRSKNHADFPVLKPKRGNFLVSFVVDSRGGAMTGNRGSGLRIIFPPGAVEQPARYDNFSKLMTMIFIISSGSLASLSDPPRITYKVPRPSWRETPWPRGSWRLDQWVVCSSNLS